MVGKAKATVPRLMFAVVVVAIAVMTLRPSDDIVRGSLTCVLCTLRSLADFVSNMVLFAPLGIASALQRGRSLRVAVGIGALFSLSIETAQLFLVPGRHANLGDFLANVAGVVVGYTIIRFRPWRLGRTFPLAHAVAASLATLALLVGGLTLFTRSFSQATYYLRWTPDYEAYGRYQGAVLQTRLGPLQWRAPQPMEPGDSVRELMTRFPVETRFIAGPPPARMAPIIAIHDWDGHQIFQLLADGSDLVFSYWASADEVRLDHPDLRIDRLFANTQPGDTIELAFNFNNAGYCLRLDSRNECGAGFSVADTWSLLISFDWSSRHRSLAGLIWVLLVYFPAGFVTINKRALITVASLSTVGLAVAPLLVGFATTPWYQIAAAIAGLTFGYAFASYFAPRGTEVSATLTETVSSGQPLTY